MATLVLLSFMSWQIETVSIIIKEELLFQLQNALVVFFFQINTVLSANSIKVVF